MADTIFRDTYPPLKALDNGDGTYSLAIYALIPPPGLTDSTFRLTYPPLRAVNNGDGTYLLGVAVK